MKITVIGVGKIKEKYFTDAIKEYAKRLSRYCKLEIVEVADEKTPDGASETLNAQGLWDWHLQFFRELIISSVFQK